MKSISEMTERELIETILALYTPDKKAVKELGHHLAFKLRHRRSLIRAKHRDKSATYSSAHDSAVEVISSQRRSDERKA